MSHPISSHRLHSMLLTAALAGLAYQYPAASALAQPQNVEQPESQVPSFEVGTRHKLTDRPGVWEVVGLTNKLTGLHREFQQVSADGTRLIPRKTCSYPVNAVPVVN